MAQLVLQAEHASMPRGNSTLVAECTSAAAECASLGDIECALFLLRSLRNHGHDVSMSSLDGFFTPDASKSNKNAQSRSHDSRQEAKPRWKVHQEKTHQRLHVLTPYSTLSPLSPSPSPNSSSSAKLPRLTSASSSCDTSRDGEDDDDTACSSSPALVGSFWEGTQKSGWESLPGEILQGIVEAVGPKAAVKACGVCSQWALNIYSSSSFLSLTWCTSDSVNPLLLSILPKFKSLQGLNLRRCAQLSDSGLAIVALSGSNLRCLLMCMSPRVTDHSLMRIAACCKNLQVLDVSGCKGVSEVGVFAVAKGCSDLKELSLCGCTAAGTNDSLISIAKHCSGLQVLNLGWCDRVGDQGIIALAKGCPMLRALDLCGCTNITDTSIAVLAHFCKDIQSLNLHCCRRLTDISIRALISATLQHGSTGTTILRNNTGVPMSTGMPTSSGVPMGNTSGAILSARLEEASVLQRERSSKKQSGRGASSWNGGSAVTLLTLPPLPPASWGTFHTVLHQELPPIPSGLSSLNVSGCLNFRAHSVQGLINVSPFLHTCPGKRSLNVSGCMGLLSVHCHCLGSDRVNGG